LKQKALEYKGNKCQVCGYKKYSGALDFHHLDPKQKDFGIGYKGYTRSWKKVQEELDKCILVCSNCHQEIHGGLTQPPQVIADGKTR
jgi:5-methylcytosine-specific restriction endonuclease McrA